MAEKKIVTVHYRRLANRDFKGLQPTCRDAMLTALDAVIDGSKLGEVDSARVTTTNDGRRMCLLSPAFTPDLAFGEIAVFREGDVPIAETDDAGQMVLKTIPLGDKEIAVLGSSYFLIHGPHLAMLHQESSTRFVREYLNWLLKQPLGSLATDEIVHLMPMAMADGKKVGLKDVKSLKIRGEIDTSIHPVAVGDARSELMPSSFSRFIERRSLGVGDGRDLLRRFGLTDGTLNGVSDDDLENLEFELIVKKREKRNLEVLPDSIIEGMISDGIDTAAEFQTDGTRRRGSAVVMSHRGEVELEGAYLDLKSVRALLAASLEEWSKQGLL